MNWELAWKKHMLAERARIIQEIRAFFIAGHFLEVETPCRIPANAPEQHIEAIASEGWFLQTSPELAMKRLLAAGYDKLFQICKVWRGNERGRLHLPEFSMLEWYRAEADYHVLMNDCIALITCLVPTGIFSWQGQSVDISPPWQVLTVSDAFAQHTDTSPQQALQDNCFEELLSSAIEPHLGRGKPTFLTEYPAALAGLARKKTDNPSVAERFELYLCGLELANAFSELNDPAEQRDRFVHDERSRRAAGKPPYPPAEKFLQELQGMPAAAGIALGIERLIMLLTDRPDIADVVAFPPESL